MLKLRIRIFAVTLSLFALGAGVRIAAVHQQNSLGRYDYDSTAYLTFDGSSVDDREYEGRGWNLISGGNFWAMPSGDGNAPPGYCFFIGAVYFAFGRNIYSLLVCNALFGGLAAVGTYFIARQLLPASWSYLAGLGVAVDPQLVYWSTRVLTESVSVAVVVVIVLALLKASQPSSSPFLAVVVGLLMALGVTIRNNMIVLFLAAVLWWVFCVPDSRAKRANLALIVAVFMLTTVPLTVMVRAQRPVGTTGQIASYANERILGLEYYEKISIEKATQRKGAKLTRQEKRHAMSEARKYINANPAWKVYLVNTTHKFLTFWRVIPKTGNFVEKSIYTIQTVVLLALASIGLVASMRDRKSRRIVLFFVVVIAGLTVLHSLVLARARYRVLLNPLLWILAAQAGSSIAFVATKRWRTFTSA